MSNFIKILLSTQNKAKSKIRTSFAKYSYKQDHFCKGYTCLLTWYLTLLTSLNGIWHALSFVSKKVDHFCKVIKGGQFSQLEFKSGLFLHLTWKNNNKYLLWMADAKTKIQSSYEQSHRFPLKNMKTKRFLRKSSSFPISTPIYTLLNFKWHATSNFWIMFLPKILKWTLVFL
jgi:hypothetical protein